MGKKKKTSSKGSPSNDLPARRRRQTAKGLSKPARPTVILGLAGNAGIDGILEAAHEYGWHLLNMSFFEGYLPPDVKPAGAIVNALPDHQFVKDMHAQGCKVVRLGRLPHPDDDKVPVVLPDYDAVGRLAADHLAERGFQELGYVGYANHVVSQTIWHGFQARAEELNCPSHLLELGMEKERNEARQKTRHAREGAWVEARPKPFAVFTYDDNRAGQICGTCHTSGLAVPEDVAILGYGNSVHACLTAPTELSSIDANRETIGREAARILQRLMEDQEIEETRMLIPPKAVIQRQSTNVLAVPQPAVARALRVIWDHFELPLSVSDVATRAGLSRSALDRAFRRYLGRTVNAELRRKRLERCTELLRSTDMSVAEIASATGFPTRSYLYRTFRQAFGVTPNQYRKQHGQPSDQ